MIHLQTGILIWSRTEAATPFQGGFLCLASPVHRTPGQATGGNNGPDDCSGTLSFQWTTAFLQGEGLAAGEDVYAQYWSRDPAASFGSSLSNALQFTLCQ